MPWEGEPATCRLALFLYVAAMAIELYQSGVTDRSAIIERVRYL